MKINQEGINIIKSFEGIEDGDPTTVNLDPYPCPSKIWTIGYGHAIMYGNRFLKSTNPEDKKIAYSLYPGGITKEQAETLLTSDVVSREIQTEKAIKVAVTANQFSALVSLVYNIGVNNFINSTLLKKLNYKDYMGAADQFTVWRRGGTGEILPGLVRRRAAERELFLKV